MPAPRCTGSTFIAVNSWLRPAYLKQRSLAHRVHLWGETNAFYNLRLLNVCWCNVMEIDSGTKRHISRNFHQEITVRDIESGSE